VIFLLPALICLMIPLISSYEHNADSGVLLAMIDSMVTMLQQAGPLSLASHPRCAVGGGGGDTEESLLGVAVDSMFDFGRQLATSTSGGEKLY
jgi:hypothetical protein